MKKVNNMTVFEPTDKCSLDEYSQKAAIEVPELIKKAKEEVNQKVIEISENDIKQDNEILELKTNHTNFQEQNTKLEEKIKKDRENMINLEVEGQSIHIEDSSDLEGQLEVLGNVEQDTREGYNLYDYMSKAISTAKGLIVTKDTENGYLIVNGTPEVSYLSVCNSMEITDILKDKATYTLWQEKYDNKLYLQVVGTKKDGTGNTNFFSASQKTAFTVDKSKYSRYAINIQIGLTTQAGTFNNYKNRYMLHEGTEEKPYEPYGVSPSPEYPSEIRAVGDNVNLLNWGENIIKNIAWKDTGESYTSENTNGTPNFIKIINTITISYNGKVAPGNLGRFNTYDKDKKIVATELITKLPYTKKFNSNEKYYTFHLVSPYVTYGSELKLELGEVPTSYSKFGQGSVGIKKQNKNIAPKLKEGKLEKQNTFICNCKKGESFTLSFRGTATTDSRLFLRTNTEFTERTDSFIEQEEITLNGTEQKITITSTIDGILYIKTGSGPQIYNFEYLQIEKGKVATEYAEHQEQTKILPIQKPMLEGDYFDKLNNKEVHTWKKIILNGQENTWQLYETGTRRFGLDLTKDLPLKETGKYAQGYCTHFEVATTMNINLTMFLQVEIGHFYIGIVDKNSKWADVNALKSELQRLYNAGTPVILYYKVETPTKLNCTPEQTKVLDELDNFPTYKPVTNITTDSIAKLKLKYIADTKTYIDNKTSNLEQQVSVINQLLSTTRTSSVLLDNLQTDIESEVL